MTKLGKLAKVTTLLIFIQIFRILLKQTIFLFTDHSVQTNNTVSALLFLLLTVLLLCYSKRNVIPLSIFPQKRCRLYILITAVYLALLISTPFITNNYSFSAIQNLLYLALIVPVFEELLFRGYLWNELKTVLKKEANVYIIITILFSVWHFGYFDSIAIRIANENLMFVLLMKALTGLLFGIVLGFTRYKTKNCFSTILLHGAMNVFGR